MYKLNIKPNILINKFPYLKNNLISGISLALLALPQSLAYALIVGLPPQSGIFAALIGTLFTTLFCSSRHLISGPTNATALLIQAGTSQIILSHFSTATLDEKAILSLQIISQIVLFSAIMQLLVSLLKLGKLTQFISRSVMMGYVIGVALTIVVSQAFHLFELEKAFAGRSLIEKSYYIFQNIGKINPLSTLLGLSSILMLVMIKKINRKWPRSLMMLLTAAIVSWLIDRYIFISSPWHISMVKCPPIDFSYLFRLPLQFTNKAVLGDIAYISFAITILSLVEVNSVTRTLSAKSPEIIDSNKDIQAIGISNLISSFFQSTLPSSGSFSRSIFNYQCGAKGKMSAYVSVAVMLIVSSLLLPIIGFIPVASLSALLIVLAYEIINFKLLKICLKTTKRDAFVLLATVGCCLLFQLDIALFVGTVLSIGLYLKVASNTEILEYVFTEKGRLRPICPRHGRTDSRIRILNIEGNLFFGSLDSLHRKIHHILKEPEVKTIILRFYNVHHIDASTCYFLELLAKDLEKQGRTLYLSEMLKSASSVIYGSASLKKLGSNYLYESDENSPIKATKRAFEHALNKLKVNE